MTPLHLREADRLEVLVLVDNYVDMFQQSETPVDRRPGVAAGNLLAGQHGLSCMIRVSSGNEEHAILLDASIAPACFFHNAEILGADLGAVESVVLSHGHFDHFGGLYEFHRNAGQKVPLLLHPEAFRERRLTGPSGEPLYLPVLHESAVKESGAIVHRISGPSTTASGLIAVTGEIERTHHFETECTGMEFLDEGGRWAADTIPDDQAVVINLADKGLVVLSGCAHAGIVNTVEYARRITGIDPVHAVLGGFHLAGPRSGPVIPPTIEAMKKINPAYIVPMHCTGWTAMHRFKRDMPGKCILNTVGTTYTF